MPSPLNTQGFAAAQRPQVRARATSPLLQPSRASAGAPEVVDGPQVPATTVHAVPRGAVMADAFDRASNHAASTHGQPREQADGGPLPAGSRPAGLPLGRWSFREPLAPADADSGDADRDDADSADADSGDAAAPRITVQGSGLPNDGARLIQSMSEAVARCIRSRPPEQDAVLADKLASFVFTDSAQDFVAAVRRGEQPLLEELSPAGLQQALEPDQLKPDQLEPSLGRPVHFHMLTMNGHSSWGGMVLYRQDIFPEGYFRTRALGNTAPSGLDKDAYTGARADRLFEQPYFRWEHGRYEFKPGDDPDDHAALRLVEHLIAQGGAKVELWRGTQEAYDSADKLLTPAADGRLPAGSMSAFGDELASVMTTPDRKAAAQWAHPSLVRFSFSPDELRGLVRERLLYAGIEYDYLEVALLYDRDPARHRGHASVQRMTAVANPGRVGPPTPVPRGP